MKNFIKIAGLAFMAYIAASCASPENMAKYASLVKTSCEPGNLECVADQINAKYTISVPAEYFQTKAIVKVTPVLVYEGGEEKGNDLWLQGEKVLNNYAVVPFKTSSSISRTVVFPYKKGMEKATLELRAIVYNDNKSKSFEFPIPYKVAEGTNCTYKLVSAKGNPTFESDSYQKEFAVNYETQILFDVNKADVKKARLNSAEVKEFEKFIKETQKDMYSTIDGSRIIGYASPEGPIDKNNTLAGKRAGSAKAAYDKTIARRANLDVPVTVEERGEDWDGFRELVKNSNIEDKELIIRVLSMYSDPNVREREIRNMSQVFQTLSTKILPLLRRSRIVTDVTKKNFSDEELVRMIADNDDRMDEESLLYSTKLVSDRTSKKNLLKKAASRFNSNRAYNNLAAMELEEGNTDAAAILLGRMNEKTPGYYNNLGVVEMQRGNFGKAKEYFSLADNKEARENMGAIDILEGKYAQAVKDLEGCEGFNSGLAKILTGDLDGALKVLTDAEDAGQSYLRAIIAVRKGDQITCENELANSFNNPVYESRVETDVEFDALR